jgi:hypothetical protein
VASAQMPLSMRNNLASQISEIEDRDGPGAAYSALQKRLRWYRLEGTAVPAELQYMERRLAVECCALSQGR